jgi:hypothetical protein
MICNAMRFYSAQFHRIGIKTTRKRKVATKSKINFRIIGIYTKIHNRSGNCMRLDSKNNLSGNRGQERMLKQ